MKRWGRSGWVGLGAMMIAASCADDDSEWDDGGLAGAAGQDARAGESTRGGEAAGGSGTAGANTGGSGGTPQGGDAGSGLGPLAGSGGELGVAGQGGAGGQGGFGGIDSEAGAGGLGGEAGAGGSGLGGEGGAPNPFASEACPTALNQTLRFRNNVDEQDAVAAAFGCPNSGSTAAKSLFVRRVQVAAPAVRQLWIAHTLVNPGRFALMADCQPDGLQPPAYTSYPGIVAEVIEPGVYTQVTCGNQEAESASEPVPVPGVNIDCEHALPLPSYGLVIEGGDGHHYSYTLQSAVQYLDINVSTQQNNGSGSVTLRGVGHSYELTISRDYLLDNLPIRFTGAPVGQYCVIVSASRGVRYNVAAQPSSF